MTHHHKEINVLYISNTSMYDKVLHECEEVGKGNFHGKGGSSHHPHPHMARVKSNTVAYIALKPA